MINPLGTLGVPGGIGGTTLGLGIVISLNDMFTKQSRTVERSLRRLTDASGETALKLERNLRGLQAGLAMMGAGAATLALASFPVREAIKFQEAITRVKVIAEDIDPKRLEEIAINLASIFPQDPSEMALALRTTVAAGIDDVEKAAALLQATNKLAVATQSNLDRSIEGTTSLVNAFRLGLSDHTSTEEALKMYERMAAVLFEATKFGKFSDTPGITDFEAMSKQMGQILPASTGSMNMPMEELMALWATSTLSGQSARKAATGLRQAFMDVINRAADPSSIPVDLANLIQLEMGYDITQKDVLMQLVSEKGFTALLGQIRKYAGITDSAQLGRLMESKRIKELIGQIQAELPEDMSIEEATSQSKAAQELVDAITDIGGISVSRVNKVFRSIWGLTAMLPILTSQWERFNEVQEKMFNLTDADINKAFKEVMDTVAMQWQLVMSKITTFMLLMGTTMLEPIAQMLKVFNLLIDGAIEFTKMFPGLAKVFMDVLTFTGVFLSVAGVVTAAGSAFRWLNTTFKLTMKGMMVFGRWARGGLLLAFTDVIAILFVLISVSMLLRKAWENNLGGIQSTTMAWVENIVLVYQAIRELFKNLDGYVSSVSGEMFQKLKDAGLVDFVAVLFAFLFRLKRFWEGFISSFARFFTRLRDRILGAVDSIDNALGPTAKNIKVLTDFIRRLMKPTLDNIEAYERWGHVMGNWAARLVSFLTIVAVIGTLVKLTGVLWALLSPLRRMALIILTNPIGATLFALAAAAWFFRDSLRETFADTIATLKRSFPSIINFFDQLETTLQVLPLRIKQFGLGRAIRMSLYDLMSPRVTLAFERIQTAWEEIWPKIKDFTQGFLDGFLNTFVIWGLAVKDTFIDIFTGIRDWLQSSAPGLATWLASLEPDDWRAFGKQIGQIAAVAMIVLSVGKVIGWVVGLVMALGGGLGRVFGPVVSLMTFMGRFLLGTLIPFLVSNPIGWAILAIAAGLLLFKDEIIAWFQNTDWAAVWQRTTEIIGDVVEALKGVWEWVSALFQDIKPDLKSGVLGILSIFGYLLKWVFSIAVWLGKKLWEHVLKPMFRLSGEVGFGDRIKNAVIMVVDTVDGLIGVLNDLFGLIDRLSNMTWKEFWTEFGTIFADVIDGMWNKFLEFKDLLSNMPNFVLKQLGWDEMIPKSGGREFSTPETYVPGTVHDPTTDTGLLPGAIPSGEGFGDFGGDLTASDWDKLEAEYGNILPGHMMTDADHRRLDRQTYLEILKLLGRDEPVQETKPAPGPTSQNINLNLDGKTIARVLIDQYGRATQMGSSMAFGTVVG